MRVAGIHTSNNRATTTEDLTMWQGIDPSVILLCQPDFSLVPQLRALIPDVYIVGRVFGVDGFDAWHPPYNNSDKMIQYGRSCGRLANDYELDCVQFANEPGIDDNDPSWWTGRGYGTLASGADAWLRGYRQVTSRHAGTIPMSPGHLFDDDPDGNGWTGAEIVKDVWSQFDVHLAHAYLTRDPGTIESEWWGRRYRRERTALGWTKRTIVTETNRDEPTPPNDEDRKSLAEFYRQWYANSEVESCFFIWDTADPNFARLTMKDNPWLLDVAAEANRRSVSQPETPTPQEEPETPVSASVFAGRHGWVWYASQSGGVDGVIAQAKALGLDGVYVKIADGTNSWVGVHITRDDVAAIQAAGLKCVGWVYAYGHSPAEPSLHCEIALDLGVDGLIVDAEAELRDSSNAERYARELMGVTPLDDLPLAVAPLPIRRFHGGLAYDVWAELGYTLMPQAYTNVLGPNYPIYSILGDWRKAYPDAEIVPAYGMYGETGYSGDSGARYPTVDDVAAFVAACNEFSCAGRSYWRLDTSKPEILLAGDPTPQEVDDVDAKARADIRIQAGAIWGLAQKLRTLEHVGIAEQLEAAAIAVKDAAGIP